MNDTPPTLYLLDGHALIYRAFYAMISRPLTTSSGENTSAPFGLARFLIRILEDFRPDYLGVVFDAGDSYRTELFPDYKATRQKMPDELAASLPRCRDIVEGFRIPVVEVEGWEADDVIGTLASAASEQAIRTVIVSGDKDFYQLVSPDVHLLNPGRGGAAGIEETTVTPENADERLGVPPRHVTDYLALIGDSSDNIPGVRGIGPKTAPSLIETYGSLDAILAHADEIASKRVRNALLEHADEARLSKNLVTIRRDAPIELDLQALRREEPDRARLRDLFLELEFHVLARDFAPGARVGVSTTEASAASDLSGGEVADGGEEPGSRDDAEPEIALEIVAEPARLGAVVNELSLADAIAIRTLSSGPAGDRRLVGLGVAVEPDAGFYLPFGHASPDTAETDDAPGPRSAPVDDLGNPMLDLGGPLPGHGASVAPKRTSTGQPSSGGLATTNLPGPDSADLAGLRALLEDPAVAKWSADAKLDLHALGSAGVTLRGVTFDASLAAYCLDPGKRRHELELLSLDRLARRVPTVAELCGTGSRSVGVDALDRGAAARHAAGGATALLGVGPGMREDLESYHMAQLLRDIELPLVTVLASMESSGVRIDRSFFASLDARLSRDLELVRDEIYKIAGGEVNLRSVPQLRELLFDRLELPILRKTKTGPSTDESVLTELAAQGHVVPRLILEHRELDKLVSTYIRKLPRLADPDTDRIHTTFNQTIAATGRLSSSDPNLQNIPIRTSLGREIRKGFIPADGHVFVSADYSQIELRVLAHLSGDAAFVEAFRDGRDIHRETAARIFDVPAESVTHVMRDQAKTINFATIYGQGATALAAQLGISRTQATEFIDNYFERFDGVARYLETMKDMARTNGYVETLFGRRRYIPEIRARNPGMRGVGERTATNSPIQGTAADLIKIAMIRLHARLAGHPGKMLLQVHDELLFETPAAHVDDLRAVVREEMEGAIELEVPLRVDIGVGTSWYDSKGG